MSGTQMSAHTHIEREGEALSNEIIGGGGGEKEEKKTSCNE